MEPRSRFCIVRLGRPGLLGGPGLRSLPCRIGFRVGRSEFGCSEFGRREMGR